MNVISENILFQVDAYGHRYQVLKDISDHSMDDSALNNSVKFIRICGRNLHNNKTTRGC